jgi:hypothetical protein
MLCLHCGPVCRFQLASEAMPAWHFRVPANCSCATAMGTAASQLACGSTSFRMETTCSGTWTSTMTASRWVKDLHRHALAFATAVACMSAVDEPAQLLYVLHTRAIIAAIWEARHCTCTNAAAAKAMALCDNLRVARRPHVGMADNVAFCRTLWLPAAIGLSRHLRESSPPRKRSQQLQRTCRFDGQY